ncbi:MAG: DegV family protein [Clostridiales bacterium]|nr:DegV family protein [Clostridiales bacterium]
MAIRIITDACCDLPYSFVQQHGISIVPLRFSVDEAEQTYALEPDFNFGEYYGKMRNGSVTKTSQIAYDDIEKEFKDAIEAGDEAIYIAFSSALSYTYNVGKLAQKNLLADYPEAKLYVVDSLAACSGQGLIVDMAVRMKENGASAEEIVKWLEENVLRAIHWFTVDDLDFLRRGGRVSAAVAIIGGMLHLKPCMHVNNEGKLIKRGVVRGRKKAIQTLIDKTLRDMDKSQKQTVYVSHGDCYDEIAPFIKQLEENEGVSEVIVGNIGPVIGAHSGPGTVAVFVMGDMREKDED